MTILEHHARFGPFEGFGQASRRRQSQEEPTRPRGIVSRHCFVGFAACALAWAWVGIVSTPLQVDAETPKTVTEGTTNGAPSAESPVAPSGPTTRTNATEASLDSPTNLVKSISKSSKGRKEISPSKHVPLTDYNAFKTIADRNIFDPNRKNRGNCQRTPRAVRAVSTGR